VTTETAPPCRGKPKADDHPMVDLGACSHRVQGSVHGYQVKACPACGVTAHLGPRSFACGPRIKAEPLTEENCVGLRWKAERKVNAS
jgi:hypothetical protein